jgi:hypothetical protein
MADHKLLRLSAILLLIGELVLTVLTLFVHAGGGDTIEATYALTAASGNWEAVHLAQFVSSAVLLAGLLVLPFALNVSAGAPRWVGFFAAISVGVALALAAVLYGLDAVANKQAELAWVSAPEAEKAARFASAQAIRWLEWGITSYYDFVFGLALVLLAVVVVWTARVPRPIGCLMALSGLAFFVLGWLVGTRGFTPANTVPADGGYTVLSALTLWLLIVAWRKESVQTASGKESIQAAIG